MELFAIFCFGLTISGIVYLGLRNAAEVARRQSIKHRRDHQLRVENRAKLHEAFVERNEQCLP